MFSFMFLIPEIPPRFPPVREARMADNVLNFAKAVKERTGVELDEERIAADHERQKERVRVDPDSDPVVRLAISIIEIAQELIDEKPVTTLAALQLAGRVLGEELISKYGRVTASKMTISALVKSKLYAAERRSNASSVDEAGPED
jgi:hypothetical protein